MPCPYGTFEASLVTLPVNGHHAVPLSSPTSVIPADAGIHGPSPTFWIPTFVGMTRGGTGNDGLGVGNDKRR